MFMKIKNLLVTIAVGCGFVLNNALGDPVVIEDEGSGEPIGIKLNLPQELIEDCQNKYWELKDEGEKAKVEAILSSQKEFDAWSENQDKIDNTKPRSLKKSLCKYAYILFSANAKEYILNGNFCKKVELGRILGSIHLKGATPCCCCQRTEAENYIFCLKCILEYGF